MQVKRDGKGQPYIEWKQADVDWGFKKAWIQRKSDPEKDWANAPRYINVVRSDGNGNGGGNTTDFPVFSELPDDQVLIAFVAAICGITRNKFD